MVVVGIALESLFWGTVWLCEERSRVWSHSVVEHLLCEVMCLGVRDGAAETLLTGVKVVPETTYLGKSSIGDDIAHIGDYLCLFVFIILYVSSAFLPPPLGDPSFVQISQLFRDMRRCANEVAPSLHCVHKR